MRRRLMLAAATWTAVVGFVAGSAQAQVATPPGGQFVVVGVVILEGGRELAWIQEPNFTDNKVVTVRLGDSVGPYRVTKILTHQVELTGPGGTVSVPLAGPPGAVSVASNAPTAERPAGELPPTPTVQDSQPVPPILPGDPRRLFPAALIFGGASPAWQPQASQPRVASVPELLPTPLVLDDARPNPPILPGDPRRLFPFERMFLKPGQGPQTR